MKTKLLLLSALGAACFGTSAMAAPLLYTVNTVATGTLGGTAFINQGLTISLIADPDTDIASFGLAPTSQTVAIGGLGSFSFTNQVFFATTFSNVFYLAGRNTTAFVRDFLDVQLPTYIDVYAPFTAVTGAVTPVGLNQFAGIATSGGALTVTQVTPVTIRAAVNVAAAVPEPASWGLMIVGFGAMGAALRRRNRPVVRVGFTA